MGGISTEDDALVVQHVVAGNALTDFWRRRLVSRGHPDCRNVAKRTVDGEPIDVPNLKLEGLEDLLRVLEADFLRSVATCSPNSQSARDLSET